MGFLFHYCFFLQLFWLVCSAGFVVSKDRKVFEKQLLRLTWGGLTRFSLTMSTRLHVPPLPNAPTPLFPFVLLHALF